VRHKRPKSPLFYLLIRGEDLEVAVEAEADTTITEATGSIVGFILKLLLPPQLSLQRIRKSLRKTKKIRKNPKID